MSNHGTLKLQEDGSYKGEFHSIGHAFPLTMVANENPKSEDSPDYNIFSGKTQLGGAWEKFSKKDGRLYYSVSINDPSFGHMSLAFFQHLTERGVLNIGFN